MSMPFLKLQLTFLDLKIDSVHKQYILVTA